MMCSGFLRWVLVLLCMAGAAGVGAEAGDIFYVDKSNTNPVQNGFSWGTAVTTIEEGIDVARRSFGGEVWVASGVYDEARGNAGTLRMRPGIPLYGGFEGNEGALSQRDPVANVTVIDGSRADDGEPAGTVVAGAEDTLIDGFTIRGGEGVSGAGMLNVDVSPLVRSCRFENNHADQFGGGVLNVGDSTPVFEDCAFVGNSALNGGAMANTGAKPQLLRCVFDGNAAEDAAGAVFFTPGSECYIQGCEFRNNTAENGGALFLDSITSFIGESQFFDNTSTQFAGVAFVNTGDLLAVNNVFARNETEKQRGGVFAILSAEVSVVNCTMTENMAPQQGGVFFLNATELRVLNCIIYDNEINAFFPVSSNVSMRYSLIENNNGGTGNIDVNPRFRNPAADDYSLLGISRALNAGDSIGAPETDINGVARPQEGAVDMGAYEALDSDEPEPLPLPQGCIIGSVGTPGPPQPGDGLVLLLCLAALLMFAYKRRPAPRQIVSVLTA